jgi:thioredoxin-related protein
MLEPEFKKLSEDNWDSPNVKFGKIDATIYSNLSKQYEVDSFPSLFFFDNSFIMAYE